MMELWPFTNFHDLNLDWIIKTIKTYTKKVDDLYNFGLYDFVEKVLEAHPEWTTTVMDGAITEAKIQTNFLKAIKNDYLTPEMFGAAGDGVTDDHAAFDDCINFALNNDIRMIKCMSPTYKISDLLTIDGENLTIDGNNCILNFDKSGFSISKDSHNITFKNIESHCTFIPGITLNDIVHFTVQGPTTTEKYQAYDINFDNVKTDGGVMGIATNSTKDVNIKNCSFTNYIYKGSGVGGYGILLQSSINVDITDCDFDCGELGRHDIYVSVDPSKTQNTRCENISIRNCYFTHEHLTTDGNGHYYSPSTIPVQVRETRGISIENCEAYHAVGFAVLLGSEGPIEGASIKNIIMDSPVYNSGPSEQRSVFSAIGSTYGVDVTIDNTVVKNPMGGYSQYGDIADSKVTITNANIDETRVILNNSTIRIYNLVSSIDEYVIRFYGNIDGDISNVVGNNLTNQNQIYYKDSAATINPALFEEKTAVLYLTLSSSNGYSSAVPIPAGFTSYMTSIRNIEYWINSTWRCGDVTARTSVNTRTFAVIDNDEIKIFNDEANLYSTDVRVTIAHCTR